MKISQRRFTALARAVIDALPDDFRLRMDNIAVLVEDRPSRRQLPEADLAAEIRITLLHELAHHFGIDDERLVELGAY